MSDPRFTLPDSPELLARAEAVARQRYEDWAGFTTGPGCWAWLLSGERDHYVATVAAELRDLTRPASYDAAIRWLVELLAPSGEPVAGWVLVRDGAGWMLRRWGRELPLRVLADLFIADPREALALAITAALEARR